MQTFRIFKTAKEAREYRHQNSTGGWIFVCDKTGDAILFPPEMTPNAIFHHPLAAGRSGDLIGSQ